MRPEIAFVAVLKKPPEDLQTRQGQCFAVLSLLCDGIGKRDGTAEPAWIRTTVFDPEALDVALSLQKDDTAFIRGVLTLDRWRDNTTDIEKAGLSCIATEIVKLGVTARPSMPQRTPAAQTAPADKLPKQSYPYEAVRARPEMPRSFQHERPLDVAHGDALDDVFERRG